MIAELKNGMLRLTFETDEERQLFAKGPSMTARIAIITEDFLGGEPTLETYTYELNHEDNHDRD